MHSIKLTVVCDQAQSKHVCVQLSDTWARVTISWPAPFSTSESIKHLIGRAARMIVAAVDSIDPDTVFNCVSMMGYDIDMCPTGELHGQIAREWMRALREAATPTSLLVQLPAFGISGPPPASALINTSSSVNPSHTVVPISNGALAASVERKESATIPASIDRISQSGATSGGTNGSNKGMGNLQTHQPPAAAVSATIGAPSTLSKDDRRAKLVRVMVQKVRQYVEAYGAAPDFSSDKQGHVEKVHKYIRSVTARQEAPLDVLEAVRREIAATQILG